MAAITYPQSDTRIFSFPSLTLAEGSSIFTGLQGFKVTAKIDGEALVRVEGRKVAGRTSGVLMIDGGVMTMVLDSALDYAVAHPNMLDEIHTITATLEEGARRRWVTLKSLRLLEFPFDLSGTEEAKVELAFSCFDLLVDGVSLIGGNDLGLNVEV